MMFFRVKLAIRFFDAKRTYHFRVRSRIPGKHFFRAHYNRSPHCCTASHAGVFPPFLMNDDYFCGVAVIHLDIEIIAHLSIGCNGEKLQFFPWLIGCYANHKRTATGLQSVMLFFVTQQSIAITSTPAAAASRKAAPNSGSVISFGCKYFTCSI